MAATCGKDGTVALLDLASAKVIAEMSKAHSGKKVLCAAWQRQAEDTNLLLTGGADKVVRCWEAGDSGATAKWAAKNVHNGDVEGVTVHASGDYFISAGADGVWAFGMVEDGRIVQKVAHDEVKGGVTS